MWELLGASELTIKKLIQPLNRGSGHNFDLFTLLCIKLPVNMAPPPPPPSPPQKNKKNRANDVTGSVVVREALLLMLPMC